MPDEQKKTPTRKAPTYEVGADEAPQTGPTSDDKVAGLQATIDELQDKLAAAEAAAVAARNVPGEPTVEVDLETGAPAWVRRVSGMERGEIKGYTVLPGNVLLVVDKDKAGHRFTFLDRQRDE